MKVPEKYRIINHEKYGTLPSDRANGAFAIPLDGSPDEVALCLVSDGSVAHPLEVWEHVSVSIRKKESDTSRIPTWDEMCWIKSIFWNDEDCVVQFHPPKSRYVNQHPNVLHLWRSLTYRQPIPPMDYV